MCALWSLPVSVCWAARASSRESSVFRRVFSALRFAFIRWRSRKVASPPSGERPTAMCLPWASLSSFSIPALPTGRLLPGLAGGGTGTNPLLVLLSLIRWSCMDCCWSKSPLCFSRSSACLELTGLTKGIGSCFDASISAGGVICGALSLASHWTSRVADNSANGVTGRAVDAADSAAAPAAALTAPASEPLSAVPPSIGCFSDSG
mmetsp:Transcript_73026/g.217937  ORF Transcript_73026/g.217937 Transcript_73026/m.217937 type:complete len:206 (+) Transcript_73026:216-833(+)